MIEPRAPLAGRAAELARLGARELPFLAQVDVRCAPEEAARLGLPLEPNTAAAFGEREALWLGPDEWLVVGPEGSAPAIVAELDAALSGRHRSVLDVSDNRTAIDLTAPDRLELLATGCGLDLDPRGGWVPGRVAQTLFARAQVLLQEREGATRVFVRPSFAAYVLDRLLAAAEILR
ncbi:MAG: sarcosine oxidase subunit gamma [Actinomycetota bacterium]|nr:MAG: sarcosine oxidase subunit gamma [Actinomycetota bacterium]